jgi:PEGA domain
VFLRNKLLDLTKKTCVVFVCAMACAAQQDDAKDFPKLAATNELIHKMMPKLSDEIRKAEYDILIAAARGKQAKINEALAKKKVESPDEILAAAWFEIRIGLKYESTDGPEKLDLKKPLEATAFCQAIDSMVVLTIETDPPEAKVYLREKSHFIGESTASRYVMPGKTKIIIEKPMYERVEEEVDVPTKNYTHKKSLTKK